MTTLRHTTLLFLLMCSSFAHAQPNPYGCHYFRHQPGMVQTTAADRELIDDVIARSDTFDILHYDITLDVTAVAAQTITAATLQCNVFLLP